MDSKYFLVTIFCTFFTLACAYHEKYFEGDCKDFKPEIAEGLDEEMVLKFGSKGFYVPLASQLLYYGVTVLMDGSYTNRELVPNFDKMCLKLVCGSIFTSVNAFGNKTVMECEMGEPGVRECTFATTRSYTAKKTGEKIFPLKGTVTWTDKKKNFVLAMCIGGRMKLWMLVSVEKTIDDATKAAVTEHVASLGFDKEKVTQIKYDKCKGRS